MDEKISSGLILNIVILDTGTVWSSDSHIPLQSILSAIGTIFLHTSLLMANEYPDLDT